MEIRLATPDDVSEIVTVLRQSLGESKLPKSAEIWNYKHTENPFENTLLSVYKKFLKDNKGEFSLSVNDLLNENTSFQQNVSVDYVEDVRSTVLQRFFMLTFTYNLRSYSAADAPDVRNERGGRRF